MWRIFWYCHLSSCSIHWIQCAVYCITVACLDDSIDLISSSTLGKNVLKSCTYFHEKHKIENIWMKTKQNNIITQSLSFTHYSNSSIIIIHVYNISARAEMIKPLFRGFFSWIEWQKNIYIIFSVNKRRKAAHMQWICDFFLQNFI